MARVVPSAEQAQSWDIGTSFPVCCVVATALVRLTANTLLDLRRDLKTPLGTPGRPCRPAARLSLRVAAQAPKPSSVSLARATPAR